MTQSRTPVDGYHKALELLGARPHFRAELQAKLAARGYLELEVESVLGRLAAEGHLDDRANARGFLRSLLERRPLGRRRLAAELARRGVDEEVVAEVLAELDLHDRAGDTDSYDDTNETGHTETAGSADHGDAARARRAAAAWARRRRFSAAALGRHLERLGFGQRVILDVLEERAASAGRTGSEPAPVDSFEPLSQREPEEPGESETVASVTRPAVGVSRSRKRGVVRYQDERHEDERHDA